VQIRAGRAAWHYISGDLQRLRSGVGQLTDSRRQGDADGVQDETGGGARSRAQNEALAVLFDLGLGQLVEIGKDFRP
jgi:hypothetical protein